MTLLATSMTWMFPGAAIEAAYAEAKTLGFDGIEHSFPYQFPSARIAQLLADNELQMAIIYAPCDYARGEKGFACVPGREIEFRDSVAAGLEYAARVGCASLGVLVGEIRDAAIRDRSLDVLVGNLRRASELGASCDIQIVLEPICRKRVPAFAVTTLQQAMDVVKRADHENLRLCFDSYHVAMEGDSPSAALKKFFPHLGYVQLANTPGRNGPDEGDLDLRFLAAKADSLGWDGWIGCEYTRADSETSRNAAWLRSVMQHK